MENQEKEFNNGALIDNRPEEEVAKDFLFKEVVASAVAVDWQEKSPTKWRKFPIFNQDGSGSCVAQTMAKMLGVMYWLKTQVYVHFSATHIYQRRFNKPSGGMNGTDVFNIARKGTTLEILVPSQDMNDAQMDAIKIDKYKEDVGTVFKIGNFVIDPVKDIDLIASIIQATGKPVMVWFYFLYPEWTDEPRVKGTIDLNAPATCRHSVTAVDFTLYKGKKCLIIEDSWGTSYGKAGVRIIDEDFFKERNWFAGHAMNFAFDEVVNPPTPPTPTVFTQTMKFGDTNPQVKLLQTKLREAGFFPSNIDCTGYFGAITKASVIKFQTKYGLVGDGVVGNITLGKLNEVFK